MDDERFANVFPTRSQGTPEHPSSNEDTTSLTHATGTQPVALGGGEHAYKARLIWLSPSGERFREPRTRSPRGNRELGTDAGKAMVSIIGGVDTSP